MALWGGEEQGLLGSKAYVERHSRVTSTRRRAIGCTSTSISTRERGQSTGGISRTTPAVKPLFEAGWRRSAISGCARNILQGIGNTDHLSFRARGSRFNAVQEYATYDVRDSPYERRYLRARARTGPEAERRRARLVRAPGRQHH